MSKTKPNIEKDSDHGGQGDSANTKPSRANLSPRNKIMLEDVKTSKMAPLTWLHRDRPSYSVTL